MVGAEPEEKELILEAPNADVPVASIMVSSLFSSRFVMVVSTQLVLAVHNQETTLRQLRGLDNMMKKEGTKETTHENT